MQHWLYLLRAISETVVEGLPTYRTLFSQKIEDLTLKGLASLSLLFGL
jgi:hypothetical protein